MEDTLYAWKKSSQQCQSRSRCSSFEGHHHSSICDRSEQCIQSADNTQRLTDEQVSGGVPIRSGLDPSALLFGLSGTQQSMSALNKSSSLCSLPLHLPLRHLVCVQTTWEVLLQTARAVIFILHQHDQGLEVRVNLDSGIQQSYITRQSLA